MKLIRVAITLVALVVSSLVLSAQDGQSLSRQIFEKLKYGEFDAASALASHCGSDAACLFMTGQMLFAGTSSLPDQQSGLNWMQKAKYRNSYDALVFDAAYSLLRGTGAFKIRGFKTLETFMIRTPHPYGHFALGYAAYMGYGTPKSVPVAMDFLEKALQGGVVDAGGLMGLIYFTGEQGQKDEYKGCSYAYEAFRDGGGAFSDEVLALCYTKGIRVQRDLFKAVELFHSAHAKGSPTALGRLNELIAEFRLDEGYKQWVLNRPVKIPLMNAYQAKRIEDSSSRRRDGEREYCIGKWTERQPNPSTAYLFCRNMREYVSEYGMSQLGWSIQDHTVSFEPVYPGVEDGFTHTVIFVRKRN